MELYIEDVSIKGDSYTLHLLFVENEKQYALSVVIHNGELQLDNEGLQNICTAYGLDMKDVQLLIYRELIQYLLAREKLYQRESTSYQTIRQTVYQLMNEKNMTVSELASQLEITSEELEGIFNGDTMTTAILLKLCLVFNVHADSILFG